MDTFIGTHYKKRTFYIKPLVFVFSLTIYWKSNTSNTWLTNCKDITLHCILKLSFSLYNILRRHACYTCNNLIQLTAAYNDTCVYKKQHKTCSVHVYIRHALICILYYKPSPFYIYPFDNYNKRINYLHTMVTFTKCITHPIQQRIIYVKHMYKRSRCCVFWWNISPFSWCLYHYILHHDYIVCQMYALILFII